MMLRKLNLHTQADGFLLKQLEDLADEGARNALSDGSTAYAEGVRDLARLLLTGQVDEGLEDLFFEAENVVGVVDTTAVCTCGWAESKARAAWAQQAALEHQDATGHDASNA